jgi:hypothetical protein
MNKNIERKLEVINKLERAAVYLNYPKTRPNRPEAVGILGDAALRVAHQPLYNAGKTPLDKATTVIHLQDATVIIIDGDRLEREVLKGSIADGDVQKLLPFKTKRVYGYTFVHIQNESAYTIQTDRHFICEGETLCARDSHGRTYSASVKGLVPTCPGCLAKGKSIIVNHLLVNHLLN